MRINCYGERTAALKCECRPAREPDETKFMAGYTYHRFGTGDKCAIHRLGVEPGGCVAATWTWGKWKDAKKHDYSLALDETMEVDE